MGELFNTLRIVAASSVLFSSANQVTARYSAPVSK
ncbi:unannotated protein [freshwater metagenome]|uniref:Unannotated protein n=1 Tax=freshwater metagenome TaxID=449393 RepID=A0A6J6AZC1_9ZZZZ